MSIRFPSDHNHEITRPGPPQKRGGGRFIFLLIFGAIAFMLMRGMNTSSPVPPMDHDTTDYPDLQSPSAQQVDTSDWFGKEQRETASQKPPQSSSNSGFSMEDVITTQNEPTTDRHTQPSTTSKPSTPKKTTKGAWGLEEVD